MVNLRTSQGRGMNEILNMAKSIIETMLSGRLNRESAVLTVRPFHV
jgi:hypothetical protein